jgi:hypothetical protein
MGPNGSKSLTGGPNKPGMGPNGNKSFAGGPNKPGMGVGPNKPGMGPNGNKSFAGGPNKPGMGVGPNKPGMGPNGNKSLAGGPTKPGNAGAGSAKGTGPNGTQSLAYGPSAANQGGAKGAGPNGNKGLVNGPNKPTGQAATSGAKPNGGVQSLAYKPDAGGATKQPHVHANMGPNTQTASNTPNTQQQPSAPPKHPPLTPAQQILINWGSDFKAGLDPRNFYTVDPFKSPGTAFSYCKLALQLGCRMPPGMVDIILAPAPGKDSSGFEAHTPGAFFKPLNPNNPLSTPLDAAVKGWNPFNQVQNRPAMWGQ